MVEFCNGLCERSQNGVDQPNPHAMFTTDPIVLGQSHAKNKIIELLLDELMLIIHVRMLIFKIEMIEHDFSSSNDSKK